LERRRETLVEERRAVDRREQKIIDDIFTYYGYKLHNMPPVLKPFCTILVSVRCRTALIEYNAKLKYILGSWADSEEFQDFIKDLVARTQPLGGGGVRYTILSLAFMKP
jgi:hypothetical protein